MADIGAVAVVPRGEIRLGMVSGRVSGDPSIAVAAPPLEFLPRRTNGALFGEKAMNMSLAVIGAGLMGGGIALDAARHGFDVAVYDARPEGFERLKTRAAKVYARWVKNGRMSEAEATAALDRLRPAASLAETGGADVVIEAVFEDLAVKREVFAALAPHLGERTILATNTSALRVRDVAEGLPHADRILGLHYFSPAEVSRLVEVVHAEATSAATIEHAHAFLAATKRVALACTDRPGFAINRFFGPYYNEAARIVEDGLATPAEVDLVAHEKLGIAAGPFQVMNLIGLAVAAHAESHLAPLGPFYAVAPSLDAHGETGASWTLEEGATMPAGADAIVDRLIAAMAVPALELAGEKVADPAEVDHGAALALKFSQGPYALMRALPPARLEAAIAALCARHGHPMPALAA